MKQQIILTIDLPPGSCTPSHKNICKNEEHKLPFLDLQIPSTHTFVAFLAKKDNAERALHNFSCRDEGC
jgi:hypothetical protein